jgi:hypothetical protein
VSASERWAERLPSSSSSLIPFFLSPSLSSSSCSLSSLGSGFFHSFLSLSLSPFISPTHPHCLFHCPRDSSQRYAGGTAVAATLLLAWIRFLYWPLFLVLSPFRSSDLSARAMTKDDEQLTELNTCVSPSHGSRPAKETTFREWMVANQIGMVAAPG